MPPEFSPKIDAVEAWVARETPGLSPAQCIQLFDRAFQALWSESRLTISALTLWAVLGRAVFNSSELYGFLDTLEVEEDGLHWGNLRKPKIAVGRESLIQGLKMLLTEFISILGNITNDVLTDRLCEVLERVRYAPNIKVVKGKTGEDS